MGMTPVASWGRLSNAPHRLRRITTQMPISSQLLDGLPGLAFGMGRSYGDACLNPHGTLWDMRGLDHWISFDPRAGLLRCQAGALLRDIQRTLCPHGWMLPVTPGTQFVTVGGAIANDVHGKNHHRLGSFGDHVAALTLARTDGEALACSAGQNADWLRASIGGLGLTGVITEATLQLRRVEGPWLRTETEPFERLQDFFPLADAAESGWEYTVSWIDCLHPRARGIFLRANHASASEAGAAPPLPGDASRGMPLTPPVSLVNPLSLRVFNALYYRLQKGRRGAGISHYQPFFYPLDGIRHWNRMYGPKGFYQYQCAVPRDGGEAAIGALLAEIARAGEGSFLAVLKTFGNRPASGLLSFAQPGVTLALDFPNKGARTLALFERLDAIVRVAKGRIYPAKDARMDAGLFRESYPALDAFLPFRDPGISSAMSRRLLGS